MFFFVARLAWRRERAEKRERESGEERENKNSFFLSNEIELPYTSVLLSPPPPLSFSFPSLVLSRILSLTLTLPRSSLLSRFPSPQMPPEQGPFLSPSLPLSTHPHSSLPPLSLSPLLSQEHPTRGSNNPPASPEALLPYLMSTTLITLAFPIRCSATTQSPRAQ